MEKTNTVLGNEFEKAGSDLLAAFSAFAATDINKVPFSHSWTPGQVMEHLVKSIGGVLYFLDQPGQPANRPADQLVNNIRQTFLDFSIKMLSPEFVVPEEKDYDKETMTGAMQHIISGVSAAIKNEDLSVLSGFAFPGSEGGLTKLELVHFGTVHILRHTHQLQNIYQYINNQKVNNYESA